MKQPKAYILVGVPGSGKTTWISKQEWSKDCAIISTDTHVESYARTAGKTYSEVFEEYMPMAVELMAEDVIDARLEQKDIIWDQTSTTISSRAKKFRMLSDYYHIAVVFSTPPMSVLTKRLANRPGKNIPLSVVNFMINSFQYPSEAEGYKEIWYIS